MAHYRWHHFLTAITVLASLTLCEWCVAGMPSPLPSSWTVDRTHSVTGDSDSDGVSAIRVQAISFFIAVLMLSSWLVKSLWNLVWRDYPGLPRLTFGRSLGMVTLWGLAFVIVLTMISGARELMTPGAWRKQGWTYTLADKPSPGTANGLPARQRQLELLRTALWQFAATHDGRLPTADNEGTGIDAALWEIPGWPGLSYLTVADCRAESAGQLNTSTVFHRLMELRHERSHQGQHIFETRVSSLACCASSVFGCPDWTS